jgi:hypothetical protein
MPAVADAAATLGVSPGGFMWFRRQRLSTGWKAVLEGSD